MNILIDNFFTKPNIWTIIISMSTLAAALFTLLMWIINFCLFKQNRNLFIMSNRPWISISNILFVKNNKLNKITDICIRFYNSGNHPATNVYPEIKILLNNRQLPITDILKNPLTIFPKAYIDKYSELSDRDRDEIINKKLPLKISINIIYQSIDNSTKHTKGNYIYDYEMEQFINLGESII